MRGNLGGARSGSSRWGQSSFSTLIRRSKKSYFSGVPQVFKPKFGLDASHFDHASPSAFCVFKNVSAFPPI